jgi:hypothetical protein
MRRLATIALATVACGTIAAHAQSLAFAYSKGATYHYTFHETVDLSVDTVFGTQPMKYDIKAKQAVTVNSVDSAGIADLGVTLTDVSLTSTANNDTTTATQSTLPTIDIKLAKDGTVVSSNAATVLTDNKFSVAGGGSMESAVLPDKAVKPGDTWSKSYDEPSPYGGGTIRVTANSKYLRDETFHGVQAAVVETTTAANIDVTDDSGNSALTIKGTATSDVTTWIDPTAHRLLKTSVRSNSQITYSSTTILGPQGSVTWKGPVNLDLEPA